MALVPAVAVRWLHLLAVAVAVGGAGLTWLQFRRVADTSDETAALSLAESYEWLFWLAVGLVALTGVGNLGAMAPAIPTEGEWATTLLTKLGLLLAFLVASVWRTLVVVRVRSATGGGSTTSLSPHSLGVLQWSYAGTTVVLVTLLALAEVLAHG
ncbi:hypothetical protein [Salinirubrum litoreum]|uniref:Copper resistance protein D n=1 Tax=Salinirubrum litoreum TaxID=1126234 RepID=A0ABD5REY7_9EURY|nr:hypothetical protein [Salinirubrum litoreum]